MEIICLKEDIGEYELNEVPQDVATFVYWYRAGQWEGDGYGLALYEDGQASYVSLSHCSCHGPLTGEQRWTKFPYTEIYADVLADAGDPESALAHTGEVAAQAILKWLKENKPVAELKRRRGELLARFNLVENTPDYILADILEDAGEAEAAAELRHGILDSLQKEADHETLAPGRDHSET